MFLNLVILTSSIIIINFFALYWSGSYFEGIVYAFLGGFGNTIPALIALLAGIIGVIKSSLNSSGLVSIISGKFLSILLFLITFLAIFSNGVLVYLKFQSDLYVNILGSPIFEIIIIVCLLILLFYKKKEN